jgi:hypothetical protein
LDRRTVRADFVERDPAHAVRAASQATGRTLRLERRFRGGAWGAFLVLDERRRPAVLKCVWDADWRERLTTAVGVVEALRADSRVPQFRAIGHVDGLGTWMLVDHLPGRPVSWLDPALLGDLLAFSDGLARDEPPPAGRFSWTAEVERRLAPATGWASLLAGNDVTRRLLEELERLVAATQTAKRRRSDLVHGDLLATQLLTDAHRRLGGILDWDAAGYGERAFDLALLFLNCHVQASRLDRSLDRGVIERLHSAATLASGASFAYYLAYHVIEMLSFVVRYNPAHVAWRAGMAREILASLRALERAS